MKKLYTYLFLVLSISLSAQDTTRIDSILPPLKVLIYTEGNSPEIRQHLYDMLRKDAHIDPNLSTGSESLDALTSAQYDVLLLACKGLQTWTQDQKENFEAFVKKGGGVVALSHAAGAFASYPFYESLLGARLEEEQPDTAQLLSLKLDQFHLITEAFPNPWISAEYDLNFKQSFAHPTSLISHEGKSLVWYQDHEHEEGNSRSFYSALGSDPSTFSNNPLFMKLIRRAIYWAGFRLKNPSPHPPEFRITRPKEGKVYKRYPKQVRIGLDYTESALSGEVNRLELLVNDSLYGNYPKQNELALYLDKPGLFEIKVRAYTDKGNYASSWRNIGIRDEQGLGLTLSIPFREYYQPGDTLPMSALIIHPNDTTTSTQPQEFGGELKLFVNGEEIARSVKSPFRFDWVIPERGEYLLSASAKSGELQGSDSLYLWVQGNGGVVEPLDFIEEGIQELYPNPATDLLSLSFHSLLDGLAYYEISTLSGKQLQVGTFEKNENPHRLELDISKLESGIYLLKIILLADKRLFSQKFIKSP